MPFKKFAKDFGSKEIILNYANRRWGFTKTNKVGEVMALIRRCQPRTFQEWQDWYFDQAFTKTKLPIKMNKEILSELGQRLYEKITEIVAPTIAGSVGNSNVAGLHRLCIRIDNPSNV